MNEIRKKTVVSLFSGCGGMDIGFEGGFCCLTKSINQLLHPDWVINENNEFVGEIAYHFDGKYYIADIILIHLVVLLLIFLIFLDHVLPLFLMVY